MKDTMAVGANKEQVRDACHLTWFNLMQGFLVMNLNVAFTELAVSSLEGERTDFAVHIAMDGLEARYRPSSEGGIPFS